MSIDYREVSGYLMSAAMLLARDDEERAVVSGIARGGREPSVVCDQLLVRLRIQHLRLRMGMGLDTAVTTTTEGEQK